MKFTDQKNSVLRALSWYSVLRKPESLVLVSPFSISGSTPVMVLVLLDMKILLPTLQILAIAAKLEVCKCIYQVRETSLTTGVSPQESH